MPLRFQGKPSRAPRDYFSRGEQVRLLTLVAALGAVVLAMAQLRRPSTAEALGQVLRGDDAPTAEAPASALPETERPADGPWLSPELLATISDNSHFRAAESVAWFAIIEQLLSSPGAIDAAAGPPLSYAQLVEQPGVYRGRPVTVAGRIRRVEKVAPAPNDLGLTHYFRVIIRPEGREVWPIFIYALERPPGAPLGEPVDRAMTARGVFFKNLSYRSESGVGLAPVVLAQGVDVAPLPAAPASATDVTSWAVARVVLIACAVATVIVLFLWLRRPGATRAESAPAAELDFDRLERQTPPSGEER